MEILTTATGKQFDCVFLSTIPAQKLAYIRITHSDFVTLATVFSDPRETAVLTVGNVSIEGYTKLEIMNVEEENIRICLAKE